MCIPCCFNMSTARGRSHCKLGEIQPLGSARSPMEQLVGRLSFRVQQIDFRASKPRLWTMSFWQPSSLFRCVTKKQTNCDCATHSITALCLERIMTLALALKFPLLLSQSNCWKQSLASCHDWLTHFASLISDFFYLRVCIWSIPRSFVNSSILTFTVSISLERKYLLRPTTLLHIQRSFSKSRESAMFLWARVFQLHCIHLHNATHSQHFLATFSCHYWFAVLTSMVSRARERYRLWGQGRTRH